MRSHFWLKKTALFCVAVCIASGIVSFAPRGIRSAGQLQAADAPSGKLTVHEWGTFTSFAGSNGVKLEFRPLVDSDLPPFVLDRWSQDGVLNPLMMFGKREVSARQRMETPVIYFYSDVERDVRVKVGFPQGLITEFYPPLESHQPPVRLGETKPMTNSVIDWGRVWVIPNSSLKTNVANAGIAKGVERRILKSLPPATFLGDHYARARDTDSAMLYVNRPKDSSKPNRPSGDFFEKFLFYRGVGNFELPLMVQALGKGEFTVQNSGTEPIRSLFLVNASGGNVKFARYGQVEPQQELKMVMPERTATVDELADAVVSALVDDKLYEKEARAMVATWRDSWFGEEGTRLFYLLPQKVTDELLPLEISPQPDELVRVLVGRLEIMTPEDERQMTEFVRASAENRNKLEREAAARSADIATVQPQIPAAIRRMGRLAEPMLTRIKVMTEDETVKREAGILLAQLVAAMNAAERALQ